MVIITGSNGCKSYHKIPQPVYKHTAETDWGR